MYRGVKNVRDITAETIFWRESLYYCGGSYSLGSSYRNNYLANSSKKVE